MTLLGPTATEQERYHDAVASVRHLVDGFWVREPGVITDFAAARNALLCDVEDAGYDWALMLDCDERIRCASRANLETLLRGTTADLLTAMDLSGSEKERVFRLPARGRYVGLAHECFQLDPDARRETLRSDEHGLVYWELPMSEAQVRAKGERDVVLLERQTQAQPDEPRWWFYLGNSYAWADEIARAREAYTQCFQRDAGELAAQAALRVAHGYWRSGDDEAALRWCLLGMERHAGLAELPCLAGAIAYDAGQMRQALRWSAIAKDLGDFRGTNEFRNQSTFHRWPPARWELPYEVSRRALRVMGADVQRIAQEDADFLAAQAARRARGERWSEWSPVSAMA